MAMGELDIGTIPATIPPKKGDIRGEVGRNGSRSEDINHS